MGIFMLRTRCRRTTCLAVWLLALSGLLAPARGAIGGTIEIAIIPTLTYEPVRAYLEAQLREPVLLITAPDYATFIRRTQDREYRYVVTASHFARLAEAEAGYRPMVKVKRQLRAILLTSTDSGIQHVSDLRGKIVSTPDPFAIISMLGIEMLEKAGLVVGKTVTVQPFASFNSAMLAVDNGEAAAAVSAATALKQMPASVRAHLEVIAESEAVPHNFFMASPDVPAAEVNRVTEALLRFSDAPERGKQFFAHTGFIAFVRPAPAELAKLTPYVVILKHLLRRSSPVLEAPPPR